MPYDKEYFKEIRRGAESASPKLVSEVLKILSPHSVVDVGCGMGTWLAEFRKQGITEVLGIDGDYVDAKHLAIDPSFFIVRDLRRPFALARKFDLAISLEVAEHLPPEGAEDFVKELARLAPVVLFSAAAPFQRGDGHVNEQWPGYWARLFVGLNYRALDCIRPRIWMDEQIAYWYRQNTILYVHADFLETHSELRNMAERLGPTVLPLVHPEVYVARSQPPNPSVVDLLRALPKAVLKAAKRRMAPELSHRDSKV